MGHFGRASTMRLETCTTNLQRLFREVVKTFDCSVIEGHRGENDQNKAFAEGYSKTQWPNSKHNSYPSSAVDASPYPIYWPERSEPTFAKDLARWYYFAGYVKGMALAMGIKIRWGGDWDDDKEIKDQNFDDLPHFEEVL